MCLELFIGTSSPLSVGGLQRLSLECSGPHYTSDVPGLENLHVTYIGVDDSCSCAVPHVVADQPIPYFDGMFSSEELSRSKPVTSELFQVLRHALMQSNVVRLYPSHRVDGTFSQPKGRATLNLGAQGPEELVFTENFLYLVSA